LKANREKANHAEDPPADRERERPSPRPNSHFLPRRPTERRCEHEADVRRARRGRQLDDQSSEHADLDGPRDESRETGLNIIRQQGRHRHVTANLNGRRYRDGSSAPKNRPCFVAPANGTHLRRDRRPIEAHESVPGSPGRRGFIVRTMPRRPTCSCSSRRSFERDGKNITVSTARRRSIFGRPGPRPAHGFAGIRHRGCPRLRDAFLLQLDRDFSGGRYLAGQVAIDGDDNPRAVSDTFTVRSHPFARSRTLEICNGQRSAGRQLGT